MSADLKPLAGRVAIVTGSGRNIGRAISLAFAGAGARVVINGHRDRAALDAVVKEIRRSGGEAIAGLADASRDDDIARMVALRFATPMARSISRCRMSASGAMRRFSTSRRGTGTTVADQPVGGLPSGAPRPPGRNGDKTLVHTPARQDFETRMIVESAAGRLVAAA